MAIKGTLDELLSIPNLGARMEKALRYAAGLRGDEPYGAPGEPAVRVQISEEVFALHQSYYTKTEEETPFEAHRMYIDLQVVLSGSERIKVASLCEGVAAGAYDADRDIAFFENRGGTFLSLLPGEAAILFPDDLHAPGVRSGMDPDKVVKLVVKVQVGG